MRNIRKSFISGDGTDRYGRNFGSVFDRRGSSGWFSSDTRRSLRNEAIRQGAYLAGRLAYDYLSPWSRSTARPYRRRIARYSRARRRPRKGRTSYGMMGWPRAAPRTTRVGPDTRRISSASGGVRSTAPPLQPGPFSMPVGMYGYIDDSATNVQPTFGGAVAGIVQVALISRGTQIDQRVATDVMLKFMELAVSPLTSYTGGDEIQVDVFYDIAPTGANPTHAQLYTQVWTGYGASAFLNPDGVHRFKRLASKRISLAQEGDVTTNSVSDQNMRKTLYFRVPLNLVQIYTTTSGDPAAAADTVEGALFVVFRCTCPVAGTTVVNYNVRTHFVDI